MSALILHRSEEPGTCACCLRRSVGVGVHEQGRLSQARAWTCDDPKCIHATIRLVAMPEKSLDAYEGAALNKAADETALPIMIDVMAALYDLGVRNLDDATPKQFEAAAHKLASTGALRDNIASALAIFGNKLRSDLSTNTPPF